MIMVRLRPVIVKKVFQNETKLYLGLMACSDRRGGVYPKQVDIQGSNKSRAGFISPGFRKPEGSFFLQWRRAGLSRASVFLSDSKWPHSIWF